ncbi:MAG: chorismate synthase [Cenarchaeum sp. SB0665_bin_23]|nr:chorismate synthase [Cenarchaeum sp. SB0665_bin_23]MYG33100.1 chorismate synthase [Cenarchaeum sp. SB0677_bin_16]
MMIGASMGHRLVLTSFGESHGALVGATLTGCPAGLPLNESDIQPILDKRRPGQSSITTQRKESDSVQILSGIYRQRSTGAPITMVIHNKDQKSADYDNLLNMPRPGHSDYTAKIRYGGYNDPRGGGIFSGRLTTTQVMGGAIAGKLLLHTLDIQTLSYTISIGNVQAAVPTDITYDDIYKNDTRCPDQDAASRMKDAIVKARGSGNTIGGVIESITTGVPPGLGEPIYNSLESDIASAIFSIPSVKGIEFGSGFAGSESTGSENNDIYTIHDNKIRTATNNSGGILGGISNGMPIVFRAAFKPASSIAKPQDTINTETMEAARIQVRGRHDPCVVPRAPPVVDAMTSLVLADHAILTGHIGTVL